MMQSVYQDFIGMYNNVYVDGFCPHMIAEFERFNAGGYCGNRQSSEGTTKTRKQDEFLFLNLKNHSPSPFNNNGCLNIFFEGLQNCFESYVNEYDSLEGLNIKCSSVKLQKTIPGAGYHVWHGEQGNDESANRVLTYILYLNTLDDDAAGETEFLYQKMRIPPQENTMVIWPAAFTHSHRGNVVHGDKAKYIITGWFYLE
jgi:hypothetical protein